ncbi:hypothetical protein [Umezawaea sp. Da 62-37]|uniref:hypothetical protein n=1 Tax=Umezawaea sp. Da 62-37 TaxID=3075927 RepID=UPI0028F6FB9A|nr:hypothetical protein [Umezawaea sp. Da 62-37]WNV85463.1 hypothetical protein RM788_46320 [Umezawaea sp. Da 62-37]
MNKTTTTVIVIALIALGVFGALIPSLRAGGFSINAGAVTTILLGVVIAFTVFGVQSRRRK